MTTTSPDLLPSPPRTRRDGWIPTVLLVWAAVPALSGVLRVTDLAGGRTTENARFFDLPAPILVHIVGATAFLVLGALQMWPSFRRRRPRWHRWSGRVLVPAGVAGGLAGMWMAAFSDVPAHDNALLMWLRLVFGAGMVGGLVLGVRAIRRRDVRTHRRWMARAYAIAQASGTQALFLGPVVVVSGQPAGNFKAIVMGAAWVVTIAVAEWLVRRAEVREAAA